MQKSLPKRRALFYWVVTCRESGIMVLPPLYDLFRFTVFLTALRNKWNLPRPKEQSTGLFLTSLRSAGLFDSVGIDKKRKPSERMAFLFW